MKISNIKNVHSVPLKERILKFLQTAPDDEVYKSKELASLVDGCPDSINKRRAELPEYCITVAGDAGRSGKVLYWGCPAAIKAFKKHVGLK